jgi:hypothetical protein
MTNFLKK